MTQENLARVHVDLHARTQDPAHLHTALAAVTGALEVFTTGGATQYMAMATRLRDDILARINTPPR